VSLVEWMAENLCFLHQPNGSTSHFKMEGQLVSDFKMQGQGQFFFFDKAGARAVFFRQSRGNDIGRLQFEIKIYRKIFEKKKKQARAPAPAYLGVDPPLTCRFFQTHKAQVGW
jgi:hypothetical protein